MGRLWHSGYCASGLGYGSRSRLKPGESFDSREAPSMQNAQEFAILLSAVHPKLGHSGVVAFAPNNIVKSEEADEEGGVADTASREIVERLSRTRLSSGK